jgi:mannose-1-phosphate guanylyltransferase
MRRPARAVILAGGLGTRLRPYTLFLPKPMLPLGDRPVLEHLIEWLRGQGVTEIAISVAYLRRIIEDYFRSGQDLGVHLTYVRSKRPLGIAGQLKAAEGLVAPDFLCLYGDALFDFPLQGLLKLHRRKRALVTMALMSYRTSMRYGFIDLNSDQRITQWREKPEVEGLINIGCYALNTRFLRYIPADSMYGMDTAVRDAIKAGEGVYGHIVKGDFVDIGDRKAYASAHEKYLGKLGRIL